MQVGIISTALFSDYALLRLVLKRLPITEVLYSNNPTTDDSVIRYIRERGIRTYTYILDYEKHGIEAFRHNSRKIIANSQLVLIFWDSRSYEIRETIRYCLQRGVFFALRSCCND